MRTLKAVRIDMDARKELAHKFEAISAPTFISIINGGEQCRPKGIIGKEELRILALN
jgi:hypothetical protein